MVTPATGAVMDIESPQEREHSLRRAAYLTVGVGLARALLFSTPGDASHSVVGYGVGLFLLLSATFSRVLVLVFPIWVLVLCALLFLRARRIPGDLVVPRPGARIDTAPLGRGGGGS